MLILLVTVFSALCAPCATVEVEEVCYGKSVTFPDATHPKRYDGPLYFTPSDGGRRKTLMEDGKAKDPRIKVGTLNLRLTDLNKKDEGVYAMSRNGKLSNVLQLKIHECAQNIRVYYKQEWSYRLIDNTHYVEYTPLDNPDVTVILWNETNLWNNDKTKGYVENRDWKISGVTQSNNNGFYNFRRRDGFLKSRILLTVKEDTQYLDPIVNERIFIRNHWTGRPWSVTFKQDTEDERETVIEDGQFFWDNMFSARLSIQENGIEIYPVESTDSGTFEFRDKQGNLVLSVQVDVTQYKDIPEANPTIIGIVVAVVALLLGICCCCCKKRCCKKDKSASAKGVPTLIYHGETQPTTPGYLNQPYGSVYPPQPVNPPAFTETAAVSIEPQPAQPNTNVYPRQPTNINPPQPEPSLYPPLFEAGSSTFQGSAANSTFSSDFLSSDTEPRFQLNSFPSAPPLSSDLPNCDVYTSEKLNFLGTN